MYTRVNFACIVLFYDALLLTDATMQKRSGLNSITPNDPSNSVTNIPTPRIIEGINLGRGRGTDALNNRPRVHLHPELAEDHPIRPQTLSSVQYEEDKPNMLERMTGKKRKSEEGSNDQQAGPSGTKEEKERPRKRYRYHYRSRRASKKENEAYGKAFGAAGAAISKKAKSIYNAGKRTVRNVRDRCDLACQRAKQLASRLRNRIPGRRTAREDDGGQQTTQTIPNRPSEPLRRTQPSPPLRPSSSSPSSSSSSSSSNFHTYRRPSPSKTRTGKVYRPRYLRD